MIYYFIVIAAVVSSLSYSQATENCFDEKGIRAKAKEVNNACKNDLPSDKEKCSAKYMECILKAISLSEPGKYEKFTNIINEYVGQEIRDKFNVDEQDCVKKSSTKNGNDQTVAFLTCFQAALIKNCPSAGNASENLAGDMSEYAEHSC